MTTEAPLKHEYDRIPYLVAYQNNSAVRDVYGGVAELVEEMGLMTRAELDEVLRPEVLTAPRKIA